MGSLGDMLALVDFKGQLEDELNFKAGDIIKNVKKTSEEGWLEGETNGKKGLFPQIFTKEIPSFFLNDNGQKFPRSLRKPNVSVQKKKPRWCRAEYSYNPGKPDELELVAGEMVEVLEEIEDGWWLGKKGDLVGAFPSNFVQEVPEPSHEKLANFKKNNKQRPKMMEIKFSPNEEEMVKQGDKTEVKQKDKTEVKQGAEVTNDKGPPAIKAPCNEYARVMFDYVPLMPDELLLKTGDVVSVLSKESEDEGWWKGELNGKIGLFPDNFVILLPSKSQIKTNKPPKRISTLKAPVAKKDPPNMDLKLPVNIPPSPGITGQKEPKENKVDPASKVAHQPAKKPAPPPPVPAKSKPTASTSAKPTTEPQTKLTDEKKEPQTKLTDEKKEPQTKLTDEKKEKNKDTSTSTSTLDGLKVSSVKLAHPTADRPKMQGKRPPKTKVVSSETDSVSSKEDDQLNSHMKSPVAKSAPKISIKAASPGTKGVTHSQSFKKSPEPGQNAHIEKLVEEIRSLKLMIEILKNKHMTDMKEIRSEISEERVKRLELQIEVENLKKLSS